MKRLLRPKHTNGTTLGYTKTGGTYHVLRNGYVTYSPLPLPLPHIKPIGRVDWMEIVWGIYIRSTL